MTEDTMTPIDPMEALREVLDLFDKDGALFCSGDWQLEVVARGRQLLAAHPTPTEAPGELQNELGRALANDAARFKSPPPQPVSDEVVERVADDQLERMSRAHSPARWKDYDYGHISNKPTWYAARLDQMRAALAALQPEGK